MTGWRVDGWMTDGGYMMEVDDIGRTNQWVDEKMDGCLMEG